MRSTFVKFKEKGIIIIFIFLITFIRLYNLDSLPSDIYGDIIIIFDYLSEILSLKWPFYFVLSSGPIYHYLITPVVLFFGLNYLAIKLASVFISFLVIVSIYLFVQELTNNKTLSLLTVFVSGVSSWLLIFSRLGNSQILTPLLSCLSFYFLAKFFKRLKIRNLFLTAFFSGLGFYSYPQTFFIAPAIFFVLTFYLLTKKISFKPIFIYLFFIFLFSLPFINIIRKNPENFFSGYIGGKITENRLTKKEKIKNFFINFKNSLLMFNLKGDEVFRSNPKNLPHLDWVSGFFFLIGIGALFTKKYQKLIPYTLWPLLFLQLPSILVLNLPREIPSASRTLLITPFVYFLVSLGIFFFYQKLKEYQIIRTVFLFISCGIILILNSRRYFYNYINGLPNKNFSFAKAITKRIDELPKDNEVYILGCCWGEWGQPEPKGILYSLRSKKNVHFYDENFICQKFRRISFPKVFIFDSKNSFIKEKITQCFNNYRIENEVNRNNEKIYTAIFSN